MVVPLDLDRYIQGTSYCLDVGALLVSIAPFGLQSYLAFREPGPQPLQESVAAIVLGPRSRRKPVPVDIPEGLVSVRDSVANVFSKGSQLGGDKSLKVRRVRRRTAAECLDHRL